MCVLRCVAVLLIYLTSIFGGILLFGSGLYGVGMYHDTGSAALWYSTLMCLVGLCLIIYGLYFGFFVTD